MGILKNIVNLLSTKIIIFCKLKKFVSKYTIKPVDPSAIPFHSHKYIQPLTVLRGRMAKESTDGSVAAGPGDSVYLYASRV
ncbi:hypothetical protein ACFL4N_04870 [Thermodesulfobacteriota bacterium]